MRFLQKYRLEIAAFLDLELFLWSATRRYYEESLSRGTKTVLGTVTMLSGAALIPMVWRLSKKWRHRAAEKVRALSRRLMRRISERVMQLLERIQRLRGRDGSDLLGGRTRVEFDLYGDRDRRKKRRRVSWKQLESERERLRWLYAGMVETKLKHGVVILPAETPCHIAARKETSPEQQELIELYNMYRYDTREEPPEGTAGVWRARYM